MKLRRSMLSLVTVLALAFGAAAVGCGPQKKFCPGNPKDQGDGKCIVPTDAAVQDAMMDGPVEERGSITVSDDAN